VPSTSSNPYLDQTVLAVEGDLNPLFVSRLESRDVLATLHCGVRCVDVQRRLQNIQQELISSKTICLLLNMIHGLTGKTLNSVRPSG